MSRQDKRIQAVLFDFDDTLIDWSQRTQSWEELSWFNIGNVHEYLITNGHSLPDRDDFQRGYQTILVQSWARANETLKSVCFAAVLIETFNSFNLDISRIDLEIAMKVYDWGPIPGVVPYDDTIPVLTHLQQNDYKIGLITNSMLPMWMRDIELQHYQMLEYFDSRLTSGDVGYIKPHTAIFKRSLASLDVMPERAVFVGDRPGHDVVGANSSGMISIWLDPPHLAYELRDVQPDRTIHKLGDLLPILEQLEKHREE